MDTATHNDIDVTPTQSRKHEGFDYGSAITMISNESFSLLAQHAYPLLEWCFADALSANREGATERLSKRLGFLSIMANYFGATPIAKLAHHIDLMLADADRRWVDGQLAILALEMRQFLPALRTCLGSQMDLGLREDKVRKLGATGAAGAA